MKFTLSWLKDHLETTESLDALAVKLNDIGLEVESIEDPGATLGAFVVAKIVEAKKHPNADKLQVVQVEIAPGKPTMEVVCGAPNARAGMFGVFAPLGTTIPGSGITLEKRPVRGIVSNGMMCSAAELELSDDSEGIIDLGDAFADKVGERYIDVAGLSDPIIDIGLTPNRPDCTGVRGIARDLAAAGMGTLKPEPKLGPVEGKDTCPVTIKIDLPKDARDACKAFAGRVVRGVKNGPSPAWMQQRLKAAGLRPINALVDVTNYISIDRGRPLHVYDVAKLNGAVVARLGKTGENFLALDGKTYTVDDAMCVIADDSGPLGLGGVIGGEASGSTDATTDVLIESAWFDPLRTAATGRKTGLQTDARYRFERGVDPASVMPGLDLATDMIVKLAGGTPTQATMAGKPPIEARTIAFDPARVAELTGVDVSAKEATDILERLGFTVEGGGSKSKAKGAANGGATLTVTVPTWRPDVHGVADLVEEVIRIAGLDRIPLTALPRMSGVATAVLTDTQKRVRRARRALAGLGFVEAVTWSFVPHNEAEHFGGGSDALELANPMSSELSAMRPNLLSGLIGAVKRNRNRGIDDMALFELGQAYRGDGEKDQYISAAGARAGTAKLSGAGRHWHGNGSDVDVFDVKADVMAALQALGFDATRAQLTRDAPAWYHPGRSGTLRLGPKTVIAYFGEVHPATLKVLDAEAPLAAFEIFLDALPADKKRKSRAKPAYTVSGLLPVSRDFAFVVDQAVAAADILRAATKAHPLVETGKVFDIYEDQKLASIGKKSVAVEVVIQPATETLTDAAIEDIAGKIVSEVKKATGGEIRG